MGTTLMAARPFVLEYYPGMISPLYDYGRLIPIEFIIGLCETVIARDSCMRQFSVTLPT